MASQLLKNIMCKSYLILLLFMIGIASCCEAPIEETPISAFYFHKSFGLIEIRDSALLHFGFPCVGAESWRLSGSSDGVSHYYSTGVSRFFCSGDPAPDTAFLSLEATEINMIKLSSKCQFFFNGQNYIYLSPLGYDGGIGEVKDLTVYHGGYYSEPSKTFSKSQLDTLISKSKISMNLESVLWLFFIGDTGYKRFHGMTNRESVWMKLRFENGDEKMQEVAIYGIHCWARDFLPVLLE